MSKVAPLGPGGFQGQSEVKPWDYRVTVCIPHLNTVEPLKTVIEVLLHQTVWPYIMVVDTGSPMEDLVALEGLRRENVEIHYLRAHGYENSSEPVAVAMDLCQSLCRTEYMFHTHSDVFLMRNEVLEEYLRITNEKNPVVGYRMSPRDWVTSDWEQMVGHTATMLHMPTIHKIGASWSMQRMKARYGLMETVASGWPDTETGFNYLLRDAGIQPFFVGEDANFERLTDRNIDHARSFTGSKIYGPEMYQKSQLWMKDAIQKARQRLSLTRAKLRASLHPSYLSRNQPQGQMTTGCERVPLSPSPAPPAPRLPGT